MGRDGEGCRVIGGTRAVNISREAHREARLICDVLEVPLEQFCTDAVRIGVANALKNDPTLKTAVEAIRALHRRRDDLAKAKREPAQGASV